jgi:glycosyltransferase involved in cell wall biosynthesis
VLLLTVGRSSSDVAKRWVFPEPPPRGESGIAEEAIQALEVEEATARFRPDVIHDHTLLGPLVSPDSAVHVTTAHGPGSEELREYYARISERTALVAISESQRRSVPEARWVRTIHNAIDVASFPFRADKEDVFLSIGRLTPDKGAHLAARAARRAGTRLLIAGRATLDDERRYLVEEIEPLLGDGVEFIGEVDSDRKGELYARARALLCPLQWEEPFGLVMVEALACGTPVIAFPRGAAPEIVRDGVTGALVEDVDAMAAAMTSLDVDPAACRASVEERFAIDRMIDEYESLFAELARA